MNEKPVSDPPPTPPPPPGGDGKVSHVYNAIVAPEKVSEWRDRYVINRYPVENAYVKFPKGTVFKIRSEPTVNKDLIAQPCAHCGIQGKITVKGSRERFLKEFVFIELPDYVEKF